MAEPEIPEAERRVLALTPTARDATATRAILGANGVAVAICEGLDQVCREARLGAGALLLTDEALAADKAGLVRQLLEDQPPWSDLPILVLIPSGQTHPLPSRDHETFRNITLVRRPVEVSFFVSTVHAAVRDRLRQYVVRDHLEAKARQAEELRRTEESLREADRRKDEFLAMLAHELRNPLAAIANAARLARMTRAAADVALVNEVITRQVGNLSRLIDDLLDVARVSQGKVTLQRSTIRLGDVVGAARELAQGQIDQKRHDLRVQVEEPDLRLVGDRTRIEQILGNILTNAAKYTEPGGHISLSARRDGPDLQIEVSDDGIGIAQDMIPKVFGLFTQVDATLDRAQGGLGIGLTLVRTLVEMHGGTVTAASRGKGQGSTFTVRLPIGHPAEDGAPATQEPPGRSCRSPRPGSAPT
jgi:signal transduction histidine kinase